MPGGRTGRTIDGDPREYDRRIRAWTLYDWANSAFAATILAAVLPVYYGEHAGATLPNKEIATGYWATGLSISLLIVAVLSPILGTIADVMRGKKRFLAVTAGVGILATGLLVLVNDGGWMLASILFIVGRVGFASANVFYDALLPHVAKPEDQDRVSTRGYAMGYLGGGLLLALNIGMIILLPKDNWGYRLSFLSVAVWWAVFSIPLFRQVPEPLAAGKRLQPGESVVLVGFSRLRSTFKHLREFKELLKYLIAFLIYNDGIGTIIGVAAIYAVALGLGPIEVLLAFLLVQFVGIPYALIFGQIPSPKEPRRAVYLAFVVFNVVALPLAGVVGGRHLPDDVAGRRPVPFEATATAVGEGMHTGGGTGWRAVATEALGEGSMRDHQVATGRASPLTLRFHGRRVRILYASGVEQGVFAVHLNGDPYRKKGEPVEIDAHAATTRFGKSVTIEAGEAGDHDVAVVLLDRAGRPLGAAIAGFEVLPPKRRSNLPLTFGLLVLLQLVGAAFALGFGKAIFGTVAEGMTTKRTILLSIAVYAVIAIWAYFIDSVLEFWILAWLVAVVQGGSQGLSRSLYARMSPSSMSGEFFGFFTVMSKFSAILGPILFTTAVFAFGSSRPAILSVIVFFVVGGYLLTRVDVERGAAVAAETDRNATLS